MSHLITSGIEIVRYVIDIHEELVNLLTLSQSSTYTLKDGGDGFITGDEEDVEYVVDTDTGR